MENKWFNKSVGETEKILQTDVKKGLSYEQVEDNRKKYGTNELEAQKKEKYICKIFRTI